MTAGVVGPCAGIEHLLAVADLTPRRPVRHHLLLLLQALLAPRCMSDPGVPANSPVGLYACLSACPHACFVPTRPSMCLHVCLSRAYISICLVVWGLWLKER